MVTRSGKRSTYWALGRALAAVSLIALVLTTCGGDDKSDGGSANDSNRPHALPAASSEAPFTEPPRVESQNGVLRFDLVASDGGIRVAGTEVGGRAYTDGLVGPTLVVEPGDTIALTL